MHLPRIQQVFTLKGSLPTLKMGSVDDSTNFEIPKECLAGVVVNEGPDFRVEVKNVPVPEIGQLEADEALFK